MQPRHEPSSRMGTFERQKVFARTDRRRLQQHGLSARRPWLRLLLKVLFTTSRYRIRVWWYRGERTLVACIRHRHTGPSPGVMSWDDIGYTFRSHLVRINSTLNSARYISGVLRPVSLPFIRALQNPMF
ncbi:uncharacterized protein TNCV_2696891 [Trichonephila clavipes]|nr:uncharacterized protein TNCV_2696891 [Trichonephila clavipes]